MEAIESMFRSEGIKFVDPSFAPSDRSLYLNTESASTWKCRVCARRSALPPAPSPDELFQLLTNPANRGKTISCAHCGATSVMLEVAMRPTGWQRPSDVRDDVTYQAM